MRNRTEAGSDPGLPSVALISAWRRIYIDICQYKGNQSPADGSRTEYRNVVYITYMLHNGKYPEVHVLDLPQSQTFTVS
jgi:hypothetical protein